MKDHYYILIKYVPDWWDEAEEVEYYSAKIPPDRMWRQNLFKINFRFD